jgi:hypothetical protein
MLSPQGELTQASREKFVICSTKIKLLSHSLLSIEVKAGIAFF